MSRRVKRLLKTLVICYAMMCALVAIFQRELLYVPYPGPTDPSQAGAYEYVRKTFNAQDGAEIPYWEYTAPNATHTLFYLHGNGGGLHAFVGGLNRLKDAGYNVVAMEYRGYPGAPSSPSQEKIVSDAVTLFDIVKASSRVPVVIWGYSLGSGVATQLAARREASAVILEAPFRSAVARAQELYFIFPARLLMIDQFRSDQAIQKINAPIYIMHGGGDFIVPDTHGRALAALAPSHTTFKFYPLATHYDLGDYGAYVDVFAWLKPIH